MIWLLLVLAGWLLWLVPTLPRDLLHLWRHPAPGRLLQAWWERLRHWEFWPVRVVYVPVLIYILGRALRHGGLTFTAVNPGLPLSGLAGESKHRILSQIAAREPDCVAEFVFLPTSAAAAERLATAQAFADRQPAATPLVLKPDNGQRGLGVEILRSRDLLEARLAARHEDLILQRWTGGREFGVFYVRHPDGRPEIFSLSEKCFPRVIGDGEQSIAELILASPETRPNADRLFERNADRLLVVPAAGEAVAVVEIGTHSLGAVCRDVRDLITPAMTARVDRVARCVDGFHFGRFDVRVEDVEAFRAGGPFRVLELNGVTSEATHIYDRRHGILTGWRTLCAQWRLAFEIGAANRAEGHPAVGLTTLLRKAMEVRQWS